MTRHRFVLGLILGVLMLALGLSPALAQNGPPMPQPVDQPEEITDMRDRYEHLSREEVEAAGFMIPPNPAACVSVPGLGGMGYHTAHPEKYAQQWEAGEMDPEDPPILLLDKDYRVRGLEWEARDLGQGTLELFGQTVELQPGHEGVEEPHFMMHVYFRPNGQVLMLSSADVPPFDPQLACPAGMPAAGAGGMAERNAPPGLPRAALAAGLASVLVVGSGWALRRRRA